MEKPTGADRPATTRPRMTMHVPMNMPLQVTPMAAYLQMPWIGPDDPSLHAKHMKRRRNDAIGLPYMAPFDGESNKKRAKPVKRLTEMIKLEPKRPGDDTAADYVAWVKFLLQPPTMWYRDQKGRQTTFAIQVGLTQGVPDAFVPLESKGYFTVKLLYENGCHI
ncbi:hypothetical protein SPRG_03029 [Saprolegnia parasitica CBS 223.65]|uniref:Uncharacterized protein n=1 Tax=Saprolegnia parasitica (strain CBS 223.65) TaxID=695850 RepID=A0A067CPC5_SAPPC|nr:hypothetical protein SPRG_03029 [Saprolegnia parasitica CBS 223.65]KDO32554.1 hypothetical protein SPRG_03029 [Saprolegnia parasitica CBS 223.65]|eukprot:XP_012197000.1 hypothetical protein SPRG_03029 [Saprolegnia parasitica CBS 223.65]